MPTQSERELTSQWQSRTFTRLERLGGQFPPEAEVPRSVIHRQARVCFYERLIQRAYLYCTRMDIDATRRILCAQ